MDSNSSNLPQNLQVRLSYTWTPPEFLTELLSLDEPLFTSSILTDDERKKTIERYPPVENLHYQPSDTVPVAARKMNRYQTKQDISLKKLQYLVSGVFRPFDVLDLEISKDDNQDNAQRYLYMLADCRSLLLNAATQINELRCISYTHVVPISNAYYIGGVATMAQSNSSEDTITPARLSEVASGCDI
ncbi:hypothetical protein INT48_003002 [Thamnidium elegans]|uniref:Uncharacterized protein n=1 Tax=Thamnidium elegans TaxID=101142 RepID=A0A8H7VX79_9FUNG|nr:hypothetical protein INT48_003002 [Thamnidium elegans]